MEPEVSNNLAKGFNLYIKEVFHSSTTSLQVKQLSTTEFKFICKGISNRFIKSLISHYGFEYVDKTLVEIAMANEHVLSDNLFICTGMRLVLKSITPDTSNETYCFLMRVDRGY